MEKGQFFSSLFFWLDVAYMVGRKVSDYDCSGFRQSEGFLLISARYMNKEPPEKALASLPDYQCMLDLDDVGDDYNPRGGFNFEYFEFKVNEF